MYFLPSFVTDRIDDPGELPSGTVTIPIDSYQFGLQNSTAVVPGSGGIGAGKTSSTSWSCTRSSMPIPWPCFVA